jgi:battenin
MTYVVFLSAAVDLLKDENVPVGVLLLCNILPGLLVQLVAPYYIHLFKYSWRVALIIISQFIGMNLVAFIPHLGWRLFGVCISSFTCCFGEITFLSLSTYFDRSVIGSFGSGTGMAGLFGSIAYLVFTTYVGFTVEVTLTIFSFFPFLMVISGYFLLSKTSPINYQAIPDHPSDENIEQDNDGIENNISYGSLKEKIQVVYGLLWTYMFPLFLVYASEYTINQGVVPTILFPLEKTPFGCVRDHYVYYQCLYQLGVFISRSSISYVKIRSIMVMSWLQLFTLLILLFQSLFSFISSVYLIFVIILWEGLLGGAVYVNAFYRISTDIPKRNREFAMGAAAVANCVGITVAALISIFLQPALCDFQVNRGRVMCRENMVGSCSL